MSPVSLRRAYRQGVFPWPISRRYPVLWFCPPERFVLELDALHISRSLRKTLRRRDFEIRWDSAFAGVVEGCAAPRTDESGTWIDERISSAFVQLHHSERRDGVAAHSVEAWQDGRLVGGLYGIAVGGLFCGESMFQRASDASKVALVALVERMRERGYDLLDCQVHTDHLARLGAREMPRDAFLDRLRAARDADRALT